MRQWVKGSHLILRTEMHHDANFVITGGNVGCHNSFGANSDDKSASG